MSIGGRSDRDRGYIDAAAALFRDHQTLSNRTRMLKYEAAIKSVVDRFPNDVEAKIFHAIFRVANAPPTDLAFKQQKEAAQLAEAERSDKANHDADDRQRHRLGASYASPGARSHQAPAAHRFRGCAG